MSGWSNRLLCLEADQKNTAHQFVMMRLSRVQEFCEDHIAALFTRADMWNVHLWKVCIETLTVRNKQMIHYLLDSLNKEPALSQRHSKVSFVESYCILLWSRSWWAGSWIFMISKVDFRHGAWLWGKYKAIRLSLWQKHRKNTTYCRNVNFHFKRLKMFFLFLFYHIEIEAWSQYEPELMSRIGHRHGTI